MSLAVAFLDDEDPETALDRLTVETEEQAAEAFAEIVELVAVINAELSEEPDPTASAPPSTGRQWTVDYGPSQAASLQVTAALARVGVKSSILDKLKKWLNKLQAKLKQIARAFKALSYTIGVSGPVPISVSVSITFNP